MDRNEILESLGCEDASPLFRMADEVRRKYCGDEVHKRAIIEFSNHCKRNCLYCGLRCDNLKLFRYRLSVDEIFEAAKAAGLQGYQTVVLQSGEDGHYPIDALCDMVRKIKCEIGCAVTLSVGERSREDYRRLKEAGADRYLLKFETSDRELFGKLKPDSSYDERIDCLRWLRELGYQVGSGCMVGLPGQTVDILADDILLMKEFDFDMIGIGPFIPHPGTPLQNTAKGDLDRVLRMVALARIVTKNAHLPATTAIGTLHPEGRQKALRSGANVIMPNFTPPKVRKYYEIYPNKICVNERPEDCGPCVDLLIRSLGRRAGKGQGHSLKRRQKDPERFLTAH